MFNFIKNIGPTELIVIGVIVLLLFGAKIAARLGRASGETFKEFKNIKKSFTDAVNDDDSLSKDKKEVA